MGSNQRIEDYQVVINGENFCLLDTPEADSHLVKSEKQNVLRTLQLGELMARLQRTGDFINLACQSTPEKEGELRASIGNIHDRFGALCGKCMQEMGTMDDATQLLLPSFNRVFRYLLGGEDAIAMVFLARASKVAKNISASMSALSGEFGRLAELSSLTLQASETARGQELRTDGALTRQAAELGARMAQAQELGQRLEQSRKALEQRYRQAHAQTERAEDRSFALSLLGTILTPFAQAAGAVAGAWMSARHPARAFLPPDPPQGRSDSGELRQGREAAEGYRQEKLQYLDLLMSKKEQDIALCAQLRQYAAAMQHAGEQEMAAQITAKALFNAVACLRQVAAVLHGMGLFWSQMAGHCDSLADPGFALDVQTAQGLASQFKQDIYADRQFKAEAVTHVAGWVALGCMARDCARAAAGIRSQAMKDHGLCLDDAAARQKARQLGTRLLGDIDTDLGAANDDRQAIEQERNATLRQAA